MTAVASATASAVAPVPRGRIVEIDATPGGYAPSSLEASPGEALTLRFTRTAEASCFSSVAVPALGIRRDLPLGGSVDVSVVMPAEGALLYECGMGMARGRIVPAGSDAPPAAGASTPSSETLSPPDGAKPHSDHDPRHGGVLTMEGDHHVEIVVAEDGRIDLYVSDAMRAPVSLADVAGTISLELPRTQGGAQQLPLAPDSRTGSLFAKGPAPTERREYTWQLTARAQKLLMTLSVPPGGTAKLAGGDVGTGGALKGVVRAVGDGHVEVAMAPDGNITLRVLDAAKKPSAARGFAATVRSLAPGSKEVALVYDEKLDVLRAKLDPGKNDHVDTTLRVTPSNGKPSNLRVSFHLSGGGGRSH